MDEFYGLKADLLWHAGHRPEDVEACFHHSLTIARRQQARSRELRTALHLSRFWQQQDKQAEAYQVLADVQELHIHALAAHLIQGIKGFARQGRRVVRCAEPGGCSA